MGTVDDYLAERAEPVRSQLARAYDVARAAAEDAGAEVSQGESYSMAALMYRGKGLFSTLETAKHIGVYPFSGTVVSHVVDQFGQGDHSKGSLRFSFADGVPDDVVRAIVAFRMAEIDAQLAKKK